MGLCVNYNLSIQAVKELLSGLGFQVNSIEMALILRLFVLS